MKHLVLRPFLRPALRRMLACTLFTLPLLHAQAQPANPASAAAPAPVSAANAHLDAEHDALRALKTDMAQAISKPDFDAVGQLLHPSFVATVNTQDSFNGLPALKQYYDDLFTRNTLRMNKISIQPEADELSQIYTGTFAITRGTTHEHYELADGRQFDMQGRWTATSIQQPDGSWKLLAVHMGVNFLDNPVINAIERSITWFAAGGAAVGLVLGFALGWLLKRPKRAA